MQARRRPGSRAIRWGAVAAWAALVFRLSAIPDPGIPTGFATPGHAVLYLIGGSLLFAALSDGRTAVHAAALAVIAASLYGATDELHQAFVPGRTPDVADWAWDTLGAAAGAFGSARLRSALHRLRR